LPRAKDGPPIEITIMPKLAHSPLHPADRRVILKGDPRRARRLLYVAIKATWRFYHRHLDAAELAERAKQSKLACRRARAYTRAAFR